MKKWDKEVQQSLLKDEKAVIKNLEKCYQSALNEINSKIGDFTARISAGNNVQSAIYQKKYQEELKKQVEIAIKDLQQNNYNTINEYLNNVYTNSFVGTHYSLHNQGIPLITPINQQQVVRAITLNSKVSNGLYSRLGVDVNKFKRTITAEVSRGISTGSTWTHIAKQISNKGNVTYSSAVRIARTEGHRIQNEASLDAVAEAKKKGADVVKQWDSTLDDKTRETHRQLDGQIRELDEYFEVNGLKATAPGHFGDPAEDCNCRCCLLQRARWGLDEDELKTLQDRAEYFELDKSKDFGDFKEKYLQIIENDVKIEDNIEHSDEYNDLQKSLDKFGVDYNPVKMHDAPLTEEEIIATIGGGDKTAGSCASLGLVYVGQKQGFDVLDFRGGKSQDFFSTKHNLDKITAFVPEGSVIKSVARSYITSGAKILKSAEVGKEYYFYCGRHAAIVRKTTQGKLQYLELQTKNSNGWTNFNGNLRYTLANRFGCKATAGRDVSGTMIDIDAFKDSDDFRAILGYINTASDAQKKGVGGFAK